MKKAISTLFVVGVMASALVVGPAAAYAAPTSQGACITIQDGGLSYPGTAGRPDHALADQKLTVGYDDYGYNYQAQMFKGSYFNVYSARDGYDAYTGNDDEYLAANPGADDHWAWDYRNDQVTMKWNDAWLDNVDCDGDGFLDRHYGFDSYVGSSAWLTNHVRNADGVNFTKIVAAPADATVTDGVWYTADGTEIGTSIWGAFAITQDVYSGSTPNYVSPFGPGFGKF